MEWIEPKVELIRDTITDSDTVTEDLEDNFNYEAQETLQKSQRGHCNSNFTNIFSEIRSGELEHLSSDFLKNNAFNCENVKPENSFADSHLGESMLPFSCFDSSDSAELLSPHQFCDFNMDLLMPETKCIDLKKEKLESTEDDSCSLVSSSKHVNVSRRSYSLGNSNSKNAIAARDNRLKKKKYIANLEETVSRLQAENERLQEESKKTSHILCGLQDEVSYLRKVIANQSTLSAILKNVMKTPGVALTTSFNSTVYGTSPTKGRKKSGECKNDKDCKLRNFKKADFPFADTHYQQVNSVSDTSTAESRLLRNTTKRNVKGKKIQKHNKKRNKFAQENKRVASTDDIEQFEDSDASDVSINNFRGGICLHVTGHNVSLEFCSLCHKSAYFGIFSDHSYVKL